MLAERHHGNAQHAGYQGFLKTSSGHAAYDMAVFWSGLIIWSPPRHFIDSNDSRCLISSAGLRTTGRPTKLTIICCRTGPPSAPVISTRSVALNPERSEDLMPPVACQGYLNAAKTALSVSPGSSALSTDLPNLQSTFGTVLERPQSLPG